MQDVLVQRVTATGRAVWKRPRPVNKGKGVAAFALHAAVVGTAACFHVSHNEFYGYNFRVRWCPEKGLVRMAGDGWTQYYALTGAGWETAVRGILDASVADTYIVFWPGQGQDPKLYHFQPQQ